MENASKALLMAGGILIAVLVLSVAVLGYTKIKSFKKTEAEGQIKKQITAFNREYESYNRQLLHGIDVLSVVNKAENNNKNIKEKESGFIKINIKSNDSFTDINAYLYEKKSEIFKCIEVKYNDEGKVCQMTFENIDEEVRR